MRLIRIVVNFVLLAVSGVFIVPIIGFMAATGDKGARGVLAGDDWLWRIP